MTSPAASLEPRLLAEANPAAPVPADTAENGGGEQNGSTQSIDKDQNQNQNQDQDHRHHHVATPPLAFSPFLIPFRDCKVVTLIRHAQGFHNAAGEKDREAYKSELYRDAHLTSRGWAQAKRAGEHWRAVYASGKLPRPELVVVSPLMRTLETASAIFGLEGGEGEGEEEEEEEGNEDKARTKKRKLLMRARPSVDGRVAAAPSRSGSFFSASDLPFIAHEDCREETGAHPCDGRRPKSQAAEAFPGVDFSLVEHEDDELYSRQPEGERETKESVMRRAARFAQWLLSRPERHVAVVSHAGFLHFFARAVGAPNLLLSSSSSSGQQQQQQHHHQSHHGERLTSSLTRWFDNAESRVVVLANASGGSGSDSDSASTKNDGDGDPLHFAGGGFEELEEKV